MARFPYLIAPAMLLLLHCGGGTSGSNFNVQPAPLTVTVGDHLAMTARPDMELSGDLSWEVEDLYGGGLRNSQGESTVYYAPEKAGTYRVTLRGDRATDGRPVKQTVTIQVLAIPSIDPANPHIRLGESVDFTATMKGLARNTVKYSVDEPGGGEVSEDGHYLPSRAGTFHVTATSTLDPSVSARATVVVGD